jgi:hypothetical protein
MIDTSNSGYLYMNYFLHIFFPLMYFLNKMYYWWLVSNRWLENREIWIHFRDTKLLELSFTLVVIYKVYFKGLAL